MIQTIRKAWGIPELRKKIVFTLLILLIFRVGNAIPTPYINKELLGAYIDSTGGSLLSLYNVMSGGAFAQATVFALGVQPYINSSIIIQLLTIAIPALERLARDGGEAGKKKIASITRYATVAIALLQAFGYYMICKNYGIPPTNRWPLPLHAPSRYLTAILPPTARMRCCFWATALKFLRWLQRLRHGISPLRIFPAGM